MIYLKVQEQVFKGKTFKQLVFKMWSTSFDEDSLDKMGYMKNVRNRIMKMYKACIESENYEGFIRDLEALELVQVLRCGECDHYVSHPKRRCLAGIDMVNPKMIECPKMTNKFIEKVNKKR